MELYLVRHGQTNGNVAHRHQADKTPLTFLGEQQARSVAQQIATFAPTHLITSRLVRSIETARVIGAVCDLVPDTNEHFKELVRPEDLYGHYHVSVPSLWYYVQWYFGFGRGVTEGESYAALRDRIKAARTHLETLPQEARVVVVSHTVFINFFLAHLTRERPLGLFGALLTFHKLLRTPNTKIIRARYDIPSDASTGGWSIIEG